MLLNVVTRFQCQSMFCVGMLIFLCSRRHSSRQFLKGSRCPASHQLNFLTIFPQKISRDVEEVQGCTCILCTVSHIGQGNSNLKSSEVMLTCIFYLLLSWTFITLNTLYLVRKLTSVILFFSSKMYLNMGKTTKDWEFLPE